MDIQVSLMRLLTGDNDRNAPLRSDQELRDAITFGPTRPVQPIFPTFPPEDHDVLMAGVRTGHVYPSDKSGGPWLGS